MNDLCYTRKLNNAVIDRYIDWIILYLFIYAGYSLFFIYIYVFIFCLLKYISKIIFTHLSLHAYSDIIMFVCACMSFKLIGAILIN